MKIDAHSTCMHRGLDSWIWTFFAIMPSVTQSRAFCLGPTLPPNEPHDFLCEMAPYIEICYAASEAGRGDPSPKVRAFCNGGWPDVRQSLSIDCLPILNKPHPYSQKSKRTVIRDAQIQITTNPMHDRNFGMFRGQRSTLGNGLSGEPLSAACHHFALPTTWRSTTAQGSRMRYSQCENAPLVLSSLYLPAGQFNHHKAKSGALQGWEDQRCSPDNRLRPFRIRVLPMSNSMVSRIADSNMGNWQLDFSQHAFLLPWKCAEKSEVFVRLFVLPGLCFQSLPTFYCRFHCRPLNRFGSVKQGNCGLRAWNTNKQGWNEL